MMASAGALLAVRAVHADLQTPVADILTVMQAGLTGGPGTHDVATRVLSQCQYYCVMQPHLEG